MQITTTSAIRVVIADVAVRVDAKGRYNLNDLHQASGAEKRHSVSYWLANQQTKDLIAEIAQEIGDTGNPVSVVKGGLKQGTYVCKELVYAYAMWISPAFNLRVIRTFDRNMVDAGDWRKLRHVSASTNKLVNAMVQLIRMEAGKASEAHHFSNEARLVNWALKGEFKGLDRDALSSTDLALLAHLEERNAVLIGRGLSYEQRKPIIKQYAMDWRMARAPAITTSED